MPQAHDPVRNGKKKQTQETETSPYTKVPHDVLEKLARFHLPLYELRVVLVIIRLTYGLHRESLCCPGRLCQENWHRSQAHPTDS